MAAIAVLRQCYVTCMAVSIDLSFLDNTGASVMVALQVGFQILPADLPDVALILICLHAMTR